jgi:hypothetical protein
MYVFFWLIPVQTTIRVVLDLRIYVFHKRVEIRHKTILPLRHKRHTLYLK